MSNRLLREGTAYFAHPVLFPLFGGVLILLGVQHPRKLTPTLHSLTVRVTEVRAAQGDHSKD